MIGLLLQYLNAVEPVNPYGATQCWQESAHHARSAKSRPGGTVGSAKRWVRYSAAGAERDSRRINKSQTRAGLARSGAHWVELNVTRP